MKSTFYGFFIRRPSESDFTALLIRKNDLINIPNTFVKKGSDLNLTNPNFGFDQQLDIVLDEIGKVFTYTDPQNNLTDAVKINSIENFIIANVGSFLKIKYKIVENTLNNTLTIVVEAKAQQQKLIVNFDLAF